jgi:ATP-dependent Zn protease
MKKLSPNNGIFLKFETLRSRLKDMIYDQDEAIDEVVDAFIHTACKPAGSPPKAVFTFLGPPAAGKTYLARSLAKLSDEFEDFRQFDMSQYTAPEDGDRLIGQKHTPDGAADGELTAFLKKHPKSIIVFNNIEKADNQLQLALLDVLTNKDEDACPDTRETVIIFISVLGIALYQNREFMKNFRENKLRSQSLIIDALSKEKKIVFDAFQNALAPKLLSLMSQNYIVLFNRLSLKSMVRIGSAALMQLSEHFTETTHIEMIYRPLESIVKLFILSFAPYINIKRIQQKLPDILLDKITRFIRETNTSPQKVVFKISDQPKNFLKENDEKSETLAQQMFIRSETLELTWKVSTRKDTVSFTVEHAELKSLSSSKTLLREELPVIRFSNIGFEDIAGNISIKKTLKEIITVLRQPDKVKQFKVDMPKGMLLYGPEGMGKTMLGKAFAKEAGLPYIYASGSEIFDPQYLNQVYQKAKAFAPGIVFLDEIDMKGIVEGVVTTMPTDQLVMELDAISSAPDEFIFTVATAQDKTAVSPEIIAPGRIDLFVEVPEFDMEARRFFIEKILEKPHDGKINMDKVVRYISGMSGYDLERIGKEASLYAIRKNMDCITEDLLIEHINNIKYGHKLDTKRIRNFEEEIRRTACHEAAHAVLSYSLLPHIKIEQVTIAPRYETLGFVSYSAEEFANNATKEEIFNNICVMLAGRTSQIRKFGANGIDSGASNDLEQATYLAYIAIASLGMDEVVGYVHADILRQNVSKQMFFRQIEEQLSKWIKDASEKTEGLVEKYWDKIEKLAEILVRQEIVDGAELEKIMKD